MSDFEHRRESSIKYHAAKARRRNAKRQRSKSRRRKKQALFLLFLAILAAGIIAAVRLLIPPAHGGSEGFSRESGTASVSGRAQKYAPSSATVTAAGDIILHAPFLSSGVYKRDDGTYDYSEIFTYCRPLLEEADLTTATFEGSLVSPETGYHGYPMFQGPDALADALAGNGIDLVNLASNHVYDGGDDGFLRTMDVLSQRNLLCAGTRVSRDDPRYLVQDVGGIRIGIVNYVYETTLAGGEKTINGIPISDTSSARINSFDSNNLDAFYLEMEENLEAMKKEGAQYIIAYMHWGTEYQTVQSDEQTQIAQKLCDLGVDALIGSHPHVIQPVDLIASSDGKHQMVCAYAIGNFLCNQRKEFMQNEMPTGETEDSLLITLSLSSRESGQVTLTDIVFTPLWVYRYESSLGPGFYIMPAGDPEGIASQSGFSIAEEVKASSDRTDAIIGDGVKKVRSALPITSDTIAAGN